MSITSKHVNIALEIDTKFTALEHKGCDNAVLFVEMSDLMPKFKNLMDELTENDFAQLTMQFQGFYRFGIFLEWVASQLESGVINVPH